MVDWTYSRAKLRIAVASERDRDAIYRLRHEVYAVELGQYPVALDGRLRDRLDPHNVYLALHARDGELAGCVSITPPGPWGLSLDRHASRDQLGWPVDEHTYEVRLLTVDRRWRRGPAATALMYAALRWVDARGGRSIVGMGRREIMPLYRRAGLRSTGHRIQSGEVAFEVMGASVPDLHRNLDGRRRLLSALEQRLDWKLETPFRRNSACYHGGAFFKAIGESFESLERRHEVVNADVLDAWFPPAPSVVRALKQHMPWLARTSPPTACEGFLAVVADARGVSVANLLPGAGSSDLIFRVLRQWVSPRGRALILDPMYGEYAHVLEHVVGCQVERFPLERAGGYVIDPDRLASVIRRLRPDLVILVNPNSPTGRFLSSEAIRFVHGRLPAKTMLWVDETYVDYVGGEQSVEPLAASAENLVVCKSMSKAYALSGLRVAYLCGHPSIIEPLREITPPWAIGLPAQVAAVEAMRDHGYYQSRWAQTSRLRDRLRVSLVRLGFDVVPGVANFLLCHLPPNGIDASTLISACVKRGLFLRDASAMGRSLGDRAVRIAVKDARTNRRMVEVIESIVGTSGAATADEPVAFDVGDSMNGRHS